MAVYEDLLSITSEESATVETQQDESLSPTQVLQRAVQRLLPEQTDVAGNTPLHRTLLNRLEQLASKRRENVGDQSTDITSVINEQEWQALIQSSVSLTPILNISCLQLNSCLASYKRRDICRTNASSHSSKLHSQYSLYDFLTRVLAAWLFCFREVYQSSTRTLR